MRIENGKIAEKTGLSKSGVSMIRNGRRFPLVETMERIAGAYGWSVEDQFAARDNYAEEFERVVTEYHTREGLHA